MIYDSHEGASHQLMTPVGIFQFFAFPGESRNSVHSCKKNLVVADIIIILVVLYSRPSRPLIIAAHHFLLICQNLVNYNIGIMTATTNKGCNTTIRGRVSLASAVFLASTARCCSFQVMTPSGFSSINEEIIGRKAIAPNVIERNRLNQFRKLTALFFHDEEADMMEEFGGGMRYEMVDLPDSMVDTTVFVGNLCEFVTDDMLSALFQKASSLNFVPACVARKPNSSSLKYGFVTFPSIEETEVSRKTG